MGERFHWYSCPDEPKSARQKPKKTAASLPWKLFPAGATLELFDGALRIDVVREPAVDGKRWTATMRMGTAGDGVLFPASAPTRDLAIEATEAWLREHARKILGREKKS